ncbi:MAG: plasmid stabilization protein [Planctomyces sp.]|nr:plasmid stabilization protein [Planctomyces sp.]
MTIDFHPSALRELREARRWYYDRNPLVAAGFAQQIQNAIERIADSPNLYPAGENGTRRFIVPRFPFTIVYLASGTVVTIVAVAHQSRRPGYWAPR